MKKLQEKQEKRGTLTRFSRTKAIVHYDVKLKLKSLSEEKKISLNEMILFFLKKGVEHQSINNSFIFKKGV